MANPCEKSSLQTFTADQFRQYELQHCQCDDKRPNNFVALINDMVGTGSSFSDNVTLGGVSFCNKSMDQLAEKISLRFPDRKLVAKVDGLRWVMLKDRVEQNGNSETYTYNGQCKKSVCLESSILPFHLDYPITYYDLIKNFRDLINTAAKYTQVDLNKIQFQTSVLYCKKEGVNDAIETMRRKGFIVELNEPYLLMGNEETLLNRQDMVVKTPPNASIPPNAEYKDHHTYKEELSLHNLLVIRRQALEKTASSTTCVDGASEKVPQQEKLTLNSLLEQLQMVASKTPLIRRYGVDVSSLTADEQKDLIEKLRCLNYSVSLDLPTFNQTFTRNSNVDCLKHLMFVYLP
jgi:hypothetical protein